MLHLSVFMNAYFMFIYKLNFLLNFRFFFNSTHNSMSSTQANALLPQNACCPYRTSPTCTKAVVSTHNLDAGHMTAYKRVFNLNQLHLE